MRPSKFLFILYGFIFNSLLYDNVCAESLLYELAIKAGEKALHLDKAWLSLLHYRQSAFSETYVSEADNRGFFLSLNGKHNPKEELIENIKAIFSTQPLLQDNHFQCLFPARFNWIKLQLGIKDTQVPNIKCKNLLEWQSLMRASKVEIVYPASYLNNASSMFGHLFLKFKSDSTSKELLEKTYNYAANESHISGVFSYVYDGIFGGLPGIFSIQPYYQKLREYSDIENRDLWKYELLLSKTEIEALILHMWELSKGKFEYFFVDENCAYRILAILESAKPEIDLAKNFQSSAIPSEILRALEAKNLIGKSSYQASAVKTFYFHLEALSSGERKLVKSLATGDLAIDSNEIAELNVQRKSMVLALATEYLTLLIRQDFIDRSFSKERLHQLIDARSKLSYQHDFQSVSKPDVDPHDRHKPIKFGIYKQKQNERMATKLSYRYLYHSFSDPLPGFQLGRQVEALNMEFTRVDSIMKLHKATLVDVQSFSSINDYLQPISWALSVGLMRHEINQNKLAAYLDVDVGVSYSPDKRKFKNLLYSTVGISILSGEQLANKHSVGVALKMGDFYAFKKNVGKIELTIMDYFTGSSFERSSIAWSHTYSVTKNSAVFMNWQGIKLDQASSTLAQVGMQFYF